MSDTVYGANLDLPTDEVEAEDLAMVLANEIRHGRSIALHWTRRNGKRRLAARVNELLGVQP